MQPHWRYETGRLAVLMLLAIVLALITGHWVLSIMAVMAGAIVWLYYKLHEYLSWVETGKNDGSLDDQHGVWGYLTHITHIKDNKSRRRKKRLSEAVKRFNKTAKVLPYGTIMLNHNRQMVRFNKQAKQMLGLDRKRDINQRLDNLIREPDFVEFIHDRKNSKIEIVSPLNPAVYLSVRKVRVDSDLTLIIIRDISERVRLNEIRKNFVANASHELRTPLTVISGYLELLDDDEQLPAHYRESIHQSFRQAKRMERLIEDLLVLSKLENSELKPDDGEQINMQDLLDAACEHARQIDLARAQEIHCEIEAGLDLFGKEKEIESICNNLLTNAVRHTDAGARIDLSWKRVDGKACLQVSDNGEGIPAEHIPRLTERFYRVDEGRSRDRGGTGLGLAIVKHAAHRHEAQLDIKSEAFEKTVFRVCFPASRVRHAPVEEGMQL